MIMKLLAILSLVLVFWCHQSHHHIFMLMHTGPLSLASEEFIPVPSEVVSNSKDEPPAQAEKAVGTGSQNDNEKKSESVIDSEAAVVSLKDVDGEVHVGTTDPKVIPESERNDNLVSDPESASLPSEKLTNQLDTHGTLSGGSHISEKTNVVQNAASGGALNDGDKADLLSGLPRDSPSEDNLSKISVDNDSLEHTEELNLVVSTNLSSQNASEVDGGDNESHSFATNVEPPLSSSSVPTPTPVPQKEDEPIPSFMEWTQIQQQKLHESNIANGVTGSGHTNGQNGHRTPNSGSSQQNKSTLTDSQAAVAKARKESMSKNFASPDCGAKVIQSNPESQNANGVLSSSHDEYMLNKCGIPIWFIVELCEPLKIEKVSLGNLELFSSSPKSVEIGISDRYPTRDWSKLGPFTLPDVRAIHSINFPATNASTFGKFLKVNILSHYGEEHFCPLSLVRVNGISEYEVLESENTHPGDIDTADKEESALYEEPVIIDQHPTKDASAADKSVFGTAKDAVINIVRKVAQVVVKSEHTKDAIHHSTENASQSNCRSLLQCLPNYEIKLREHVLSLLSCNFSNLLPFLNKNSPWCGWDYCHALFSKHSIGLPWQPEGFYASIFGGPSVLHALCNYHRPLSKELCSSQFVGNGSETSADIVSEEGIINETVRSHPVKVGSSTEDSRIPEQAPTEKNVQKQDTGELDNRETSRNMGNGHKSNGDTDQPAVASGEAVEPLGVGDTRQTTVPLIPTPQSPPPSGNIEEALPGSVPQTNTQNTNNQQIPIVVGQQQQQQQQKESVFVRLSNRIKTLERNQSLTASYLEELSRRFKKQNEENYHINEETKTFKNESRVKLKVLEDLYRFELRSLRRNTDEIRERLFNVQLQRSVLILLCLLQFVGIVSVCFYVRKRFRQFELQIQRVAPFATDSSTTVTLEPTTSCGGTSSTTLSTRSETPQHNLMTSRKRLNSDIGLSGNSLNSIDKSKKIKKKKKKLPDLKPVNVKISGPASAPIDCIRGSDDGEFKFNYPQIPPSASAFDVVSSPLYNFKENVNPQLTMKRDEPSIKINPVLRTPPPTTANGNNGSFSIPVTATNPLSTQVDSPFQMISSTSTNFTLNSGVSTSSRFALLASPGLGGITSRVAGNSSGGMKRSGSLTSLDSSSTSSYSAKTGSHNITNGHGDSQSQGSSGSGKKRKNKGLKALMPKIFDR